MYIYSLKFEKQNNVDQPDVDIHLVMSLHVHVLWALVGATSNKPDPLLGTLLNTQSRQTKNEMKICFIKIFI